MRELFQSIAPFSRVAPLMVVGLIALPGCEVNLNSEGIISRETKTFSVKGQPDLQLETFDGSIEVHSWDRNEVEVEIEKRAMEQATVDEMKVSAEQQGDRIVIKVSRPERTRTRGIQVGHSFGPTARLRVAMPRQSQLTALSGDGAIVVEDIAGKLTLTTQDGSIRASRVSGDLVVRSGDGAIRMDDVAGRLDIETEDGSVTLEAQPTALKVRTSDGTIRLRVKDAVTMAEDWDVQTADGGVVLTLPSSFNAEIDASSRDGVVRANHPGVKNETRAGDTEEERRQSLRTTLGSGGRTLRVRSGDGSIRIEG